MLIIAFSYSATSCLAMFQQNQWIPYLSYTPSILVLGEARIRAEQQLEGHCYGKRGQIIP